MVTTLAVAALGAWLWRVRLPRAEAGPAPPAPAPFPRVSVIVPARDEARNLPALLASLFALDPAPAEVIVVDDGSTDATAAVAAAAGARVVTAPPPPPGWTGKPWACLCGADAASGELLLFTDADTIHAPPSLGRAVAHLGERRADVLSVVPSHRIVRGWEALQGIFQLLLLVAAGRAYAIGQYLLFRREAYDRIGGHAAARARIAEDLALTARLPARALLAAPGLLEVRMYPEGLGAFVRGWMRNFREGLPAAGLAGGAVMVLVVGWLLGLPLGTAVALAGGDLAGAAVLGAATLVTAAEIAWRQRLVGRFAAASALAYPLFVGVFAAISLASAVAHVLGRPVVWRGRRFVPGRVTSWRS